MILCGLTFPVDASIYPFTDGHFEGDHMDKVRIGVIGLGNMGSHHVGYMDSLDGAVLSAVCDADPARADKIAQRFPNLAKFTRFEDLLESGSCDAILIATPHYQHPL